MAHRHMLSTGLATFAAALLISAANPAAAAGLTSKECGAKYQAAKSAGTLNGMDYKAFRTSQCAAAAVPATTAAAAVPVAPGTPASPTVAAPVTAAAATKTAPVAKTTVAKADVPQAGSPSFPSAIDPKYASLSAGKGREKTCLDQYHANKATGGNAGMKWIQKGGGFYSSCNKRLKSA